MAVNTPIGYQNLVIYQLYVRSHTPQGTFAALLPDLPRIRAMGVDWLHLLPVHPIGQVQRKGGQGSPYSISDYRAINPEYGTLSDFDQFLAAAHRLDMRVMMDVVFNHTAHDSALVREHPDWFHQDDHGRPLTTVPEWSDVIDLKYPNPDLEFYLIETLRFWAAKGADGFRCDVASLVPLYFWLAARAALEQTKPGMLWLAESVHAEFVTSRRAHGLLAHSDSELFQAFDICYDYDIWPVQYQAMNGQAPASAYLDLLQFQRALYPANAHKLRCVENHDQPRVMAAAPSPAQALAWTGLQAFNQGPFLIYAGQEAGAVVRPSLFDADPVPWGDYIHQPFLTRLAGLKKHPAQRQGRLVFSSAEPVVTAYWLNGSRSLGGIFNVSGATGRQPVHAADGPLRDWVTGRTLQVERGSLSLPESLCVFDCDLTGVQPAEYRSRLM